ncbi:MFS transporter [Pseudomonadales bacterium]|nr:MFS transporter [Pseudomonadales bacterium]
MSQMLAYAAPMVPVYVLNAPALAVLPALYAKHAPISMAAIGAVLMFTRLFDVATDPLIGYLSDNSRSSLGPRKPWIILGASICMLAVYFLFRPGPSTGVVYFLIWSVALYLGWTLVEIPHAAWLKELSNDYAERTRISGFRAAAQYLGQLLFIASPLLPFFVTTEMTPEVTAFSSWVVIAIMPVTIFLCIRYVPAQNIEAKPNMSVRIIMRGLIANRPLRFFAAAHFGINLSMGMSGALYFFFLDNYLHILDKIAHLGVTAAIISLVGTPIWSVIIPRIGKHVSLAICAASNAIALAAMSTISSGPLAFPLMLLIYGSSALTTAGMVISLYALMADIVDYDQLKTGTNNSGSYYSVIVLLQKLGIALGAGLAFLFVGLFGFDAKSEENSAFAMSGFFLAFLVIPIILNIGAAFAAWFFPLDRRRQAVVSRRLNDIKRRGGVE